MTTEKLTEQDIEEMERLEQAVTPGDWHAADCISPRLMLYAVPKSRPIATDDVLYLGQSYADGKGQGRRNADFIARARSFVPRAIADLRRLRAENAALAYERDGLLGDLARHRDERDRLGADLRSKLTAATERAERAEAQIKEARTAYGLDEDTADQHDISLADCIRLLRDQRDYLAEQAEKEQP